jgi:adenylate cyclase
VEIQANMISGLLDGAVRDYPHHAQALELLILLGVGLLMSVLLPQIGPLWGVALTAVLAASVTAANLYFWSERGEVIPLASTYLLIALLYLFHVVLGFTRERHLKGRLERRFGQYVPPALVEKMREAPVQEYGFSGEIREMTVLFADLRGFTGIAEALPPQELTQFMHEWLTPMTRIIHRHGGTIDKYMGDCVMAFWGAPLSDPEHARHALEAALAMQTEIPRLNEAFALRGWPRLRLGVGINSGDMRVGNMGSEFRVAYTVLGDAVNLGSRLEALTSRYGVPVVVSGELRAKVPDHLYLELDRVRVKGKQKPVTIYYPLGSRETVAPQTLADLGQYHRALDFYLQRHWREAEQIFTYLRSGSSFARQAAVYLERIAHYRIHPPGPAWDGVFSYFSER